MVSDEKSICDICGSGLVFYDRAIRIFRTKNRETKYIRVNRMRCPLCGTVRRVLPDYILPHKQYELEVIKGVLEGFITPDTIGFEDYPCEATMKKWKSELNYILQ